MLVTPSQRAFWQRHWAAEAEACEQRRRQLQEVAASVAEALRQRWPALTVWLFGSVLGPGFREDSDLDLALEGLPSEALLEAMAVAETRSDALLIAADKAPVAVDLVRLEALPEPWQARIRRDGQRLA